MGKMSFYMFHVRFPAPALLLALAGAATTASAFDSSLEASLEYRYFPSDAVHEEQHEGYGSLALKPEFYLDWDRRDQSITVELFGRLDQYDDERTHADVREAFYRYTARDFEWRVGVRQLFWGVLESAHIVDVINQTDFVEDIDGEAKLGEPMVNFAWFSPIGTIDFFVLPTFRERTFAGEEGRPRLLLPVDTMAARADDEHMSGAIRYFKSFGRLDAGLYWFHGTSREPRFDLAFDSCDITLTEGEATLTLTCEQLQALSGGMDPPDIEIDEVRIALGNARFVPVYDRMDQAGIDLQYVTGALALKAEAIHHHTEDYHFSAAGAGLEYTLYDPFGSGYDLGLLAEYLYDNRGNLEDDIANATDQLSRNGEIVFKSVNPSSFSQGDIEQTQNSASFQDDLFLGARLALNDLVGTEILAGATYDFDTGAVFGTLEASRRFFGVYRAELTGRLFSQTTPNDALYGFRDDDYLELTITRFF